MNSKMCFVICRMLSKNPSIGARRKACQWKSPLCQLGWQIKWAAERCAQKAAVLFVLNRTRADEFCHPIFTSFRLLFLFALRWRAISVLLPVEPVVHSWKHKFAVERTHHIADCEWKKVACRGNACVSSKKHFMKRRRYKSRLSPLRAYCPSVKKRKTCATVRAIAI